MPKYYCDYCDTYLTHDSPSVRKTHCQGRKHKDNVKFYYQKWMEEQAQHLIDATTAAFKAGKIASNPFAGGNPVSGGGGGGGGVSIPPPSNMNPNPRPMPPPMMGPMGHMGPMGLMMGPHGPMHINMMQMHGPRGPPMHPMMHPMQQMGGPPNMRAPPLLAGPIGIKK